MEQDRYQVRFDWGLDGATAVGANADVIVWVDVVPTESSGSASASGRIAGGGTVLAADFTNASAVAAWIVAEQNRSGKRLAIAVIAAGAARADGYRFAVEDLLAAGAIIRCLGELGLDATSPEAAATESAYLGLGRALSHLVSASVSAEFVPGFDARAATRIDSSLGPDDVLVLRSGV